MLAKVLQNPGWFLMSGHRLLGVQKNYGRGESNTPWGPELGCTAGRMEMTLEQQWEDTVKNHLWLLSCAQIHKDLEWAAVGPCQMSVPGRCLLWPSKQLTSDPTSTPVVCPESDKGNIMIQRHGGIRVAMHKMGSWRVLSVLQQPVTGTRSYLC